MGHQLTVLIHKQLYAICRLGPEEAIPGWASAREFLSISRTARELSIVCEQEKVPSGVYAERNRRLCEIEGTLPFALTGVLAAFAGPLANAGVSLFGVSTYDRDYFLVSDSQLAEAAEALEGAGHTVQYK
jgi:hypothetical protein